MNLSTELVTKVRSTAHRRIIDGLRDQILTGKYTPGTQLPSTKELAVVWNSSPFTVHVALKALAKEGWIDRRHGSGTYIADPDRRFLCAGVYCGVDLRLNVTAFVRNLHFALLSQLKQMKKTVRVFIDSRPDSDQVAIMPEMAEAILNRNIQCLIAPGVNAINGNLLSRLALPTAFISNPHSTHRVNFDMEQFFRESATRLAAQGCTSVGLISNVLPTYENRATYGMYYDCFLKEAAAAGLATRDEWVRKPSSFVVDRDIHGFREFKNLWGLGTRPDGLIVYPDDVVSGVILAVLELGAHLAPARMKFVFHRNAHFRVLCPFAATWAISDEDILAEGLIRIVEKQFQGEKTAPISLPYVFEQHSGDH